MPQTLAEIRSILDTRGLRPKHALGQNFLVDHNLLRKLVDAAHVKAGDLVLEVGPGTGTLTDELLERGARVNACELDKELGAHLAERFAARGEQFRLVLGDCLESKRELSRDAHAALGTEPFKLVANLPYGAGTPLMLILMSQYPQCGGMWVTIQYEVGERMLASPASREFGPLGVIAQASGEVKQLAKLSPECFWPRPKIDSAMLQWVRGARPTSEVLILLDFCAKLFSQRRKQLGSVLGRETVWPDGVVPQMRAEELSVAQICALAGVG